MSEEMKNETMNETEESNAFSSDEGKLVLSVPIRARSHDVEVLYYDFSKLTNKEYIGALSADRGATDPFHLTSKQAFSLFCAAAAKCTEDIDATDINERMAVKDTVFAVQIAMVFFAVASREASNRTVNG